MVNPHELYEIAFESLAKMECPDFSEVDDYTVFNSFCQLYSGQSMTTGPASEENLEYLCDQVAKRSKGKVTLTRTDFQTGIKGDNAQFLLSDGETTKKVSFGPYARRPFEFYGDE